MNKPNIGDPTKHCKPTGRIRIREDATTGHRVLQHELEFPAAGGTIKGVRRYMAFCEWHDVPIVRL